jgi:hypothetical protein
MGAGDSLAGSLETDEGMGAGGDVGTAGDDMQLLEDFEMADALQEGPTLLLPFADDDISMQLGADVVDVPGMGDSSDMLMQEELAAGEGGDGGGYLDMQGLAMADLSSPQDPVSEGYDPQQPWQPDSFQPSRCAQQHSDEPQQQPLQQEEAITDRVAGAVEGEAGHQAAPSPPPCYQQVQQQQLQQEAGSDRGQGTMVEEEAGRPPSPSPSPSAPQQQGPQPAVEEEGDAVGTEQGEEEAPVEGVTTSEWEVKGILDVLLCFKGRKGVRLEDFKVRGPRG